MGAGRTTGPLAAVALASVQSIGVNATATASIQTPMGRIEIATIPTDPAITLRSATYTATGKVLVSYAAKSVTDATQINLAVMDDDGRNFHSFFSQQIPRLAKSNGIRFMIFADNRRILLGDYVIECAPALDACTKPALLPVTYPKEVSDNPEVRTRWSEIVISPDNRHIAWTTLLTHGAAVFVGELAREATGYKVVNARIVSTMTPFRKDPAHADGVLPDVVRGGEVKQFVHGGTALSLVGSVNRVVPNSVVQNLLTGQVQAITDTPGYTETTIFSPDERLGLTMTTRFSDRTDPAILGLLPRPYPGGLDMGLSMLAYTYAVTGVRRDRLGNVGPALIDIAASQTKPGYRGIDLNTEENWVFYSPMSWHPGGRKAMWIERDRKTGAGRIQTVRLADYRPAAPITPKPLATEIPFSSPDLSLIQKVDATSSDADIKVYGRNAGYIRYRHTPAGHIEKVYEGYSDDGKAFYSGSEAMDDNPQGRSTYVARIDLTGPHPGKMDLKITFGPLSGTLPAQLIFDRDTSGQPLTDGYAEYDGVRLTADRLLP